MHTYRIRLKLQSGLGTPLAADTLWGHVAWGIRWRSGNRALEDWLARYDADDPPLTLSDPLPHGYFPRPMVPQAPRSAVPPTKDQADRQKLLDKRKWISHEAWQTLAEAVSAQRLEEAFARTPLPLLPAEVAVTRAGINRLTGGTAQAEGGVLFTGQQTYYDFREPPQFDLWCLSPEPLDAVRQWLEDALVGGYGRDAAAGLGNVVVAGAEDAQLPSVPAANACMILGPAVPRPGDPQRGFFSIGIRCGRLGGDFAVGGLPDGAVDRQKRPVRCLLAGSLLLPPAGVPPLIGRVLRGAHPRIEAVRHYGIAPALPCRLVPDLLEHRLVAGRIGFQPVAGRQRVAENSGVSAP
jgi:CRISPR-associated protein Csm4